MSEQTNAPAPAGWYPDSVPGQLRWWDGTTWSDHVAPGTAASPYQTVAERPALPEGTRTDSAWIWVLAFLPLLGLISLPLSTIGMGDYFAATLSGDYQAMITSMFGVWYLVTILLGLFIYAGSVVAAYLDFAHLRRIGVVRPFHWAWTFLYALIYQIGRTVILRKVSRTGLPVLWVAVAVYVVAIIVAIVWSVWLSFSIMQQMMDLYPYGNFGDYGY
jgi:hypothetical protein